MQSTKFKSGHLNKLTYTFYS